MSLAVGQVDSPFFLALWVLLKVFSGHGYVVGFSNSNNNTSVIIGSSWTRGLAIHAVGTSRTDRPLALLF
jgi:hypothetical protein